MMKILVVSYEVWRNDNNGGNVLSSIFEEFDAEFAQIYCTGGVPDNDICEKYYQITDGQIISSLFHGTHPGKKLEMTATCIGKDNISDGNMKEKSLSILYKLRWPVFLAAREVLWHTAKWKTPELETFIREFNPDIIFAPCYGILHMLNMDEYVKKLTGCPMISYISDDSFSLKRLSFSPVFWIDRIIVRKKIRALFKLYDLVYTMTDDQKVEYESALGTPMKILCKCGEFSFPAKSDVHRPIRFIYAGGLYLNRWKILSEIGKTLDSINNGKNQARLDIYSTSKLTDKQRMILGESKSITLNPPVNANKLSELYSECDVALHVESFDLKNSLATRLSFSTKIIDCLNSGCATVAIGPRGQAGINYLERTDAAICIRKFEDIKPTLVGLIENPKLICEYVEKARIVGKKNHQKTVVHEMIKNDFNNIMRNADESCAN